MSDKYHAAATFANKVVVGDVTGGTRAAGGARLPGPGAQLRSRSRPAATIAAPSAQSAQARGASRSLPLRGGRATPWRASWNRAAREVVLTGVDITSYDGGLGALCHKLLAELPRLNRLRLSSLDSIEIDGALMELVAGEPRLPAPFPPVAAGRRRPGPQAG